MAIKVALSAALLVALLALAGATSFTTTVTTTSLEDSRESYQERQCRQQLQGRQLRACQSYLTQRGPYEEVVEMVTRNPQPQQYIQECCQSLKEIEQQRSECGCEAVKHALRQAQQSGQVGSSAQVYQRAQMLPNLCSLRTQQCQIRAIFV